MFGVSVVLYYLLPCNSMDLIVKQLSHINMHNRWRSRCAKHNIKSVAFHRRSVQPKAVCSPLDTLGKIHLDLSRALSVGVWQLNIYAN